MMVEVSYEGCHNFDFDTRLEQIAGRARADSQMNFDTMQRTMTFEFNGEEEDQETSASDLFIAAVQQAFPNFTAIEK